jgi:hypothetical protein
MAKKTSSKSMKTTTRVRKPNGAAKKETEPAAAKPQKDEEKKVAAKPEAVVATEKSQAAKEPRTRDPRLPPAGTTLKKVDGHGAVRCQCEIKDDGVHYGDKVYRSLSAAAMAAAKDLGLGGSQNGYLFWGIVKQPRRMGDPLVALDRAWQRYHGRARSIIQGATDDNRDKVRAAIEKQAKEIGSIVASVA